jgi:hypothetical protein
MDSIDHKDVTISDINSQETNGMNKGAKNTTAGEEPAPLPAEPGDASVSGDVGDDRVMKADAVSPPPVAPAPNDGAAPPPVEDTRSDVGGPAPVVAKDFGDDDDDSGSDDDDDSSDDDDDADKGFGEPEVTGAVKVKKGKKSKTGKAGKIPPKGEDLSLHTDSPLEPDADFEASTDMGKSFPPAVKRLHDACCIAYSEASILKEYGDSSADILRSTGQEVMFTALRNAVAADMGKGIHVAAITDLTDAYSTASLVALASPSTLKEVRGELHKSFVSENSDALADDGKLPSPKDAGQPEASKYKRPLITSGQSKPTATGGGDSGARIPSSGDTPKGSDFTGNGVSAGQERPSPANKSASRIGPAGAGASTYFGNAAKDQAANAMNALHDHLSYTFPDMCPMGPASGISNTPVNNAGGKAVSGYASQSQGLTSVPATKVTGAASNAVANKVYTGDVVESDEADDNRKLEKQNAKLKKRVAKLNKQLIAYGAEPDPFKAPVRGVMVGDVYEAGLQLRKSEIEEYAEMLSASSNPDYRLRAQDVLNKLGK